VKEYPIVGTYALILKDITAEFVTSNTRAKYYGQHQKALATANGQGFQEM
jgi:hypothetical protein